MVSVIVVIELKSKLKCEICSKLSANAIFQLTQFVGITYLISDLKPNTSYLVRVAARNPAGLSDWIGPKEFKTNYKGPLTLPSSATINEIAISIYTISLCLICFRIEIFPNDFY